MGPGSPVTVRREGAEYEISSGFYHPCPARKMRPAGRRRTRRPRGTPLTRLRLHEERTRQRTDRAHVPSVRALSHRSGMRCARDIISNWTLCQHFFYNGPNCVLIAAHYGEMRSSAQNLCEGSESQQEGRFAHVRKVKKPCHSGPSLNDVP